ncbi:MAG: glutamine--tRNA ligase/YqeY domain fusion protein [Alphaproteobacteria bacterium]|jgi:glutaminyl-tRNA synthetase|nr:glutamine--tRNA ligase/YqeY domain fusion protein [Alphaproteobacteria bacterium]
MSEDTEIEREDFVRETVRADLAAGKHAQVVTRFPPEPNGYLHLGHAKSICLNFGVADEFGGRCHLRFDDTNPAKEEQAFIDGIQEDVRWLGFDWGDHLHYASDYFEQLYDWAVHLIKNEDAYVCDLSAEDMRLYRGTLTEPGRPSPGREYSVEQNLDVFARMRAGEFPEGSYTLRARIDMSSGNMNLRDPALYRVKHAVHPRTGDAWKIYPTYDFAHGQSDAIEGITHSLCTLEFADHRPLYEWLLERVPAPAAPRQYEFARLNITYTVLSKRVLTRLVTEGHVDGWDDPRMPTIRGIRRRGVPAAALKEFIGKLAVSRSDSTVEVQMLDHAIRENLNHNAERRMAVLKPLKVTIRNWPEGQVDMLEAQNHPGRPELGTRMVPFSGTLWVEQDDFMEDPPRKFFRLGPGREVRLRFAYFITCEDFVKDADGNVVELICTYDPATKGGNAPDGRKVKGTIHWVSAGHAVEANANLLNPLFLSENPSANGDPIEDLNPDSLERLTGCKLEPCLGDAEPGTPIQFERLGYFSRDQGAGLNFIRTIALRDSYAKAK